MTALLWERSDRKMTRKTKIAFAAVIAVLAIGGAAAGFAVAGTGTARPLTVYGSMTIDYESCSSAAADYPDIGDGTQVVITDPAGTVVATSALGTGGPVPGPMGGCNYPFTAAVVAGQPRYGVTIGRDRGTVWFTAAQMRRGPDLILSPPAGP